MRYFNIFVATRASVGVAVPSMLFIEPSPDWASPIHHHFLLKAARCRWRVRRRSG